MQVVDPIRRGKDANGRVRRGVGLKQGTLPEHHRGDEATHLLECKEKILHTGSPRVDPSKHTKREGLQRARLHRKPFPARGSMVHPR